MLNSCSSSATLCHSGSHGAPGWLNMQDKEVTFSHDLSTHIGYQHSMALQTISTQFVSI